jgi:hypothetical protein
METAATAGRKNARPIFPLLVVFDEAAALLDGDTQASPSGTSASARRAPSVSASASRPSTAPTPGSGPQQGASSDNPIDKTRFGLMRKALQSL